MACRYPLIRDKTLSETVVVFCLLAFYKLIILAVKPKSDIFIRGSEFKITGFKMRQICRGRIVSIADQSLNRIPSSYPAECDATKRIHIHSVSTFPVLLNGLCVAYVYDEFPTMRIPGPAITAIATSARLGIWYWLPLGGHGLRIILNPKSILKAEIFPPQIYIIGIWSGTCIFVSVWVWGGYSPQSRCKWSRRCRRLVKVCTCLQNIYNRSRNQTGWDVGEF